MSKESKKQTDKKMKRILFAIAAVTIVLIIVFICIFFLKPKNNEEQLKENMVKMGTTFYEKFYYPQITSIVENKEEFMKTLSVTGVSVTLESLESYSGTNDKTAKSMKNAKTGDKCKSESTIIIIYPKEPYSKKDYSTEVILDCGFDKK